MPAAMVTAEQFAAAIIVRLTPLLPSGFSVRVDDDMVVIDTPDGHVSGTALEGLLDRDDLNLDDYADAAWNLLSMVQDIVSETTTEPWPAAAGPGGDLAEPGTRVEGTLLLLYFGADEAPAVTLPPIDLAG